MYDVAASLYRLLFRERNVDNVWLLERILSTSLLMLQKRGYNGDYEVPYFIHPTDRDSVVDRILKQQKAEVESYAKAKQAENPAPVLPPPMPPNPVLPPPMPPSPVLPPAPPPTPTQEPAPAQRPPTGFGRLIVVPTTDPPVRSDPGEGSKPGQTGPSAKGFPPEEHETASDMVILIPGRVTPRTLRLDRLMGILSNLEDCHCNQRVQRGEE